MPPSMQRKLVPPARIRWQRYHAKAQREGDRKPSPAHLPRRRRKKQQDTPSQETIQPPMHHHEQSNGQRRSQHRMDR